MRNLKTSTCIHCQSSFKHGSDTRGKFCTLECSGNYKRSIYEKQPKSCKLCHATIPYESRTNTFCSSSCGTKNSNMHRSEETKLKRKQTYSLKPSIRQPAKRHISVIKYCLCGALLKPYFKYCSDSCKPKTKPLYRKRTQFKLNKKDHAFLFNSLRIQKYGWYCPSNRGTYNPTGLSWDHLYRVEDGYQHDIDPAIMRHPANAELVPWTVNKSRRKSLITINELKQRIILWDSGRFEELQYFFID